MDSNLIYDVGMCNGKDTEFYLKKGFNVVAIEANPALCKQAQNYFSDYLKHGNLTLYNIAIADYEGEIEFFINDKHTDWGTTSKDFASRNEKFGTTNFVEKVKCDKFEHILSKNDMPYYIKIDIEGADLLCLKALEKFDEKPKYVSIEAGLNSFNETFSELSLLWNLGYKEYKIVNQAINDFVKCPYPPLEGAYINYNFDSLCSGPFGEEAPGIWMDIEDTFVKFRKLLKEQKYFGANGKMYGTILHKVYNILKREPVGWYDFHAKLE